MRGKSAASGCEGSSRPRCVWLGSVSGWEAGHPGESGGWAGEGRVEQDPKALSSDSLPQDFAFACLGASLGEPGVC